MQPGSKPNKTNYRQQLHNHLQNSYKNQTTLSWSTFQAEPLNTGLWTAVAYINHEEFGRGSAPKLDHAKEQAAYNALRAFRGDDN